MKKLLALFVVAASALCAQSEKIDLGPYGKLTLYLPEGWAVNAGEFGEKRIVTIEHKNPDVNADCKIEITLSETDLFPSKAKLKAKVESLGLPYVEQSVEGKARAEPINVKPGYGFACTFTDPELIGKPPQKGNFKNLTKGLIRLTANVVLDVAIEADGVTSKPYQDLLGAIEGMEYEGPRDRKGTI